jgi:hypothetical protein
VQRGEQIRGMREESGWASGCGQGARGSLRSSARQGILANLQRVARGGAGGGAGCTPLRCSQKACAAVKMSTPAFLRAWRQKGSVSLSVLQRFCPCQGMV